MESSSSILARIKAETDEIIVDWSMGKDSTALLVEMTEHFSKIHVMYYYQIPGLKFVDDQIKDMEAWLGQSIHRMPWPDLFNYTFTQGVWWPTFGVEPYLLPEFTEDVDMHDHIRTGFCRDVLGLDEPLWVAGGMRACDSMTRRRELERVGVVQPHRKTFEAIWDWSKQDCLNKIALAGLNLSEDYVDFGRSWEGVDSLSASVIEKRYPEDWKTILEWQPMAQLALARQHYVTERYGIETRSWRERMRDGDEVQR